MNKKISLSESIRSDINKIETLVEAAFNIGKPELPQDTVFHGNIDMFLSLESDQDIVDSGDNSVIIPANYKEIVQIAVFQNGEYQAQPTYRPYSTSIEWNLNNSYSVMDIVYNDYAITCTATSATYDTISCNNTSALVIGQPIVFSGTVFGGIVANDNYYVTTVVDDETFTISKSNNPVVVTATQTFVTGNYIKVSATSALNINDPVIFNQMQIAGSSVTDFGGITSGQVYYIATIDYGTNKITVSETANGGAITITADIAAAGTPRRRRADVACG